MGLEEEIIGIAVEHWIRRHTGISAIEIAERLKISHKEILRVFAILKSERKGSLNENVLLYHLSVPIRRASKQKVRVGKPRGIVTSIFFPSRELLAEYFEQHASEFIRNGEYLNRLHRGGHQLEICYFDAAVLRKYQDNSAMYDVHDDVAGGYITLNSSYASSLSDEEYSENGFDMIRYGKRKTSDSRTLISPILCDLARLPKREQNYWASYELEPKEFSKDDPDFSMFVRQTFEGQFVDTHDPIKMVYGKIKSINHLLRGNEIFNHEINPRLRYPIADTKNDLDFCLKELFKLISDDNLNAASIKQLLRDGFGFGEKDFVHQESGRRLSQIQLLKLLLRDCTAEERKFFDLTFERIRQGRIRDAHKITHTDQEDENFIELFKEITLDLFRLLEWFEAIIQRLV